MQQTVAPQCEHWTLDDNQGKIDVDFGVNSYYFSSFRINISEKCLVECVPEMSYCKSSDS